MKFNSPLTSCISVENPTPFTRTFSFINDIEALKMNDRNKFR